MIIVAALFLFAVLVIKSNHCNRCTNAWAKHFIALLMIICFATIVYAIAYPVSAIVHILGSLLFFFIAAEAWPVKSNADGGS